MKYILSLILMFSLISFSCKKDNIDAPIGSTPLDYSSLYAEDSTITVNEFVKLHALATGDELKYKWSNEFGSIIGSGKDVEWSVCHAGRFMVECEVSDKYGNKASKSIDLYAK